MLKQCNKRKTIQYNIVVSLLTHLLHMQPEFAEMRVQGENDVHTMTVLLALQEVASRFGSLY